MTVLVFSFQKIVIACVVFAKVKASWYIIIKIVAVFLMLGEENHCFSVVRSRVVLSEANCLQCLADILTGIIMH